MPAASLSSLPVEVTSRICEFVAGTHPPSLPAFARTSKHLYGVATALLYRTLDFDVRSHEQLVRDIHWRRGKLQRDASFGHVHVLTLNGPRLGVRSSSQSALWTGMSLGSNIVDGRDRKDDGTSNQTSSNIDAEAPVWELLVELLQNLPALTDLVYGYSSRPPSRLLRFIYSHRPNIRLHLPRFQLEDKNAPISSLAEQELLTCPNLYSLRAKFGAMHESNVPCEEYDAEGLPEYTAEAIMSLVAGLAPDLKHVCMDNTIAFDGRPELVLQESRQHWRLAGRKCQPQSFHKGSLQSLCLSGNIALSVHTIEAWRHHTDMSILQTLRLECSVELSALEDLEGLELSSLKSLTFNVDVDVDLRYVETLRRFLSTLPPLETLELDYGCDFPSGLLSAISIKHGASLRRLALCRTSGHHSFQQPDIECLQVYCHSLEELSITIERSQGRPKEVKAYRILGTFPLLETLDLTLDASKTDIMAHVGADDIEYTAPSDETFDEFCRQFTSPYGPRNGHIRDAFINSAIDERLALSIFEIISSARPAGTRPFENLRVCIVGGADLGGEEFQAQPEREFMAKVEAVIREISPQWQVARDIRDDRRDQFHAVKLTNTRDDGRDGAKLGLQELDPAIEPIFRYLWPLSRSNRADWRQSWSSLPLHTANDL